MSFITSFCIFDIQNSDFRIGEIASDNILDNSFVDVLWRCLGRIFSGDFKDDILDTFQSYFNSSGFDLVCLKKVCKAYLS